MCTESYSTSQPHPKDQQEVVNIHGKAKIIVYGDRIFELVEIGLKTGISWPNNFVWNTYISGRVLFKISCVLTNRRVFLHSLPNFFDRIFNKNIREKNPYTLRLINIQLSVSQHIDFLNKPQIIKQGALLAIKRVGVKKSVYGWNKCDMILYIKISIHLCSNTTFRYSLVVIGSWILRLCHFSLKKPKKYIQMRFFLEMIF